jgi:LAO/AO transport system kinase
MKKNLSLDDYVAGFSKHDRTILAQAITLVESSNKVHVETGKQLIEKLLPLTGKSKRIGISGTPGVGKSTFIEAFGKLLTSQNKSVAVLTVDPTSKISGGSILGDKTRMNELAVDPLAFIRPSPSGLTLGGVASRTRESILLCEAFGFDYILIETVGVGQSETTVSQMVDIFLMLLQPGSGDDLQGIKRGILELVDMVIVTKDDGDNHQIIQKACHDYQKALHILRHEGWIPSVLSCSALKNKGLKEIQEKIEEYFQSQINLISLKRKEQNINWFWQLVDEGIREKYLSKLNTQTIKETESLIKDQNLSVPEAAAKIIKMI